MYFALDCNRERLGSAGKYFDAAGKRINIDHHESNKEGVGDVNAIEPDISSTCELLYTLFDKKYVDKETAICIFTGMVTDTGVFQYSCTSPETMRRAAELMEYGFDHSALIQRAFYEKTYLQTQILGRCLMESVRFMDGKCVVSWIDRKTQDFYQVTSKDFEGIVSQLRNIRGVEDRESGIQGVNEIFRKGQCGTDSRTLRRRRTCKSCGMHHERNCLRLREQSFQIHR